MPRSDAQRIVGWRDFQSAAPPPQDRSPKSRSDEQTATVRFIAHAAFIGALSESNGIRLQAKRSSFPNRQQRRNQAPK